MLEPDFEGTEDLEPQFPLAVHEAISVYTLYSIFLEDVIAGVEEGILREETPVQLRAILRQAFPTFIADLREFLAEHVPPEIMTATEEKIIEARKLRYS